MKGLKVNTSNIGGLVGRLTSPNTICYDTGNGTIENLHLIGNVVDTEYNDVFIIGEKVNDSFKVYQMESLPTKENEIYLLKNDEKNIYAISFISNLIKEMNEGVSKNGTPYTKVSINDEKNSTIYLTIMGKIIKNKDNPITVLMKNPLKIEENKFGSGYAIKTVVTKYGMGSIVG